MTEQPGTLIAQHLSPPCCPEAITEPSATACLIAKGTADTDETPAGSAELIVTFDAFSLNDRGGDSEMEIIEFGPVELKRKKTTELGKAESRLSDAETKCNTHPFFLNVVRTEIIEPTFKPSAPAFKPSSKVPEPTSKRGTMASGADEIAPVEAVPKLDLPVLPPYSYKAYIPAPTVVFTRHEEEANDLVGSLKGGPIGFDMEWRVLWSRRANSPKSVATDRRVAVVQLADTNGLILVIQLWGMSRFPKKLQELIENPSIPKLGANILNDGKKLLNDYGILSKNFLELGALVHLADPSGGFKLAGRRSPEWKNIISLAKLVGFYCNKDLEKPKALRMGNWEADLDQLRIEYAANDAHCALKVYEQLVRIASETGVTLTDELIQKRCSNDVANPCINSGRNPSSNRSSPDVATEVGTSKTVQLRRHETMPNILPSATENSTMRPQYLRAYRYWYEHGMPLQRMCIELSLKRSKYPGTIASPTTTSNDEDPATTAHSNDLDLKPSTVISYIVGALQADSKLNFKMDKLRELVQMEASSWERHRDWLLDTWKRGRGVMC